MLGDVFGDRVDLEPSSGPATFVQGIFRREPIEVDGDDGAPVLILSPTLQVTRDQTVRLERGCEVLPSVAPGERFRVVNGQPTRSPASDAFVIYELELVE
ncbi:hypothetical protein C8N36_102114 [Pelagimonas varians]|uniref:Uncharacterized protein n=2 Tax=Pelagimonas varians TaxID=696760 RepID=A0A238JYK3_9RHOB|nr:hypothetical protein C8N36_102114 [Pelagimonas varians]SMX35735.1 hypothetical protein PEV8663_00576 [Pelagimonas varians]